MRIALFVETYLPMINGVVTHVKILKDGLEQLGHQVLIVTADPHTHRHYLQNNVLHCPAVEMKRFYGFGLSSPVDVRRLKIIADFHPDIIHIHQEFSIGLFGVAASRILKVPLVYTLHTMYDEYIYYIAPRPLTKATKRFSHKYIKFFAQHAASVTGPSQKCAEYLRAAGVNKSVNIIPNPVELDAFSPRNISQQAKDAALRTLQEKCGVARDAMLSCFVGRLGREKSVDVLLSFWAKAITPADKLHLIVIGDGPVRPELQQQAQELGISQMVSFTGSIMHDQLPPYLVVCDAYVTASLSDTNSISMKEGMAAGLPVLQLYDQLNADQIQEGKNGFVFRSAEELAEKLRKLREMSPEQRQTLSQSVMESVSGASAKNLAGYLLEIYQQAIDSRKKS